jgi:antirestriction protein
MSDNQEDTSINKQEQTNEEQTPKIQPSIYVASLSDYNNGYLHGRWIRADQSAAGIWSEIREMLQSSPEYPHAEEWAIHDFDDFGPIHIEEQTAIETVAAVGQLIVKHGEPFAVWAYLVGLNEANQEDAEERFLDSYIGVFDSAEDYAEQSWDSLGFEQQIEKVVPENLRYYVKVDYEMLARDMELTGDVDFARDDDTGGVYAFEHCW